MDLKRLRLRNSKLVVALRYSEIHDIVIISTASPSCISAFHLTAHHRPIWELHGTVADRQVDFRAICCDTSVCLYVGDGKIRRILLLGSRTGDLQQVLPTDEDMGDIVGVAWDDNDHQLAVLGTSGPTICFYCLFQNYV